MPHQTKPKAKAHAHSAAPAGRHPEAEEAEEEDEMSRNKYSSTTTGTSGNTVVKEPLRLMRYRCMVFADPSCYQLWACRVFQ